MELSCATRQCSTVDSLERALRIEQSTLPHVPRTVHLLFRYVIDDINDGNASKHAINEGEPAPDPIRSDPINTYGLDVV
jgi:hypothetical protein